MEHQVVARRDGHGAVLQCQACRAEHRLDDGRFEVVNDFIAAHRACPQDAARDLMGR